VANGKRREWSPDYPGPRGHLEDTGDNLRFREAGQDIPSHFPMRTGENGLNPCLLTDASLGFREDWERPIRPIEVGMIKRIFRRE
jgi:hypothetical protein